jgi:hypothetical protein
MVEGQSRGPERVVDSALLGEIESNCAIFAKAWNELRASAIAIGSAGSLVGSEDAQRHLMFETWGRVYSMIEAANRLTRILWEVKGCQLLRSRYRLSSSPELGRVAPVRRVRNALEHTETRIPGFVRSRLESEPHALVKGWGLSNLPTGYGPELADSFRCLNIYTFRCVVRDSSGEHECDLRALAKAVQDLNLSLPSDVLGFHAGIG